MAKKSNIKKSIYNRKSEIEHLRPNENTLKNLKVGRIRISRNLKTIVQHSDLKQNNVSLNSHFSVRIIKNKERSTSDLNSQFRMELDRILERVLFTDKIFICSNNINGKSTPHCYIHTEAGNRASSINEELRKLRLQIKKKFSKQLLNRIRSLIQELYSIVSFFHSEQRKYVKRIYIGIHGAVSRDIRNIYRQIVNIIFKCLPDFSGCDEEARFTPIKISKPDFFTFYQKKYALQSRIFT